MEALSWISAEHRNVILIVCQVLAYMLMIVVVIKRMIEVSH